MVGFSFRPLTGISGIRRKYLHTPILLDERGFRPLTGISGIRSGCVQHPLCGVDPVSVPLRGLVVFGVRDVASPTDSNKKFPSPYGD